MRKEHILVVEDDEDIQQLVGYNLIKAGFMVTYADTGEQALAQLPSSGLDCILLDLMLPAMSGFEVCRAVRENPQTRSIPIIMLTAKGEEDDIATGLDLGADDYITKPFSPKVLISRIRAVLRRKAGLSELEAAEKKEPVLRIHDLVIDSVRHEVMLGDQPIALTVTEFAILEYLARHPGWVFSRQQIIDEVRGYDYMITPRSVDVQVFGLRKKLGETGKYVETVRGIGYRFKE